MSEQETKTTEESSIGGNLDAAGSAAGSGSVGVDASSKKSEEKRKPKKLGQKSAESTPAKADNQAKAETNGEVNGEADAPEAPEAPETPKKMEQQSRSKSRQGSRARGRGSSQPPSDTDSAYRSDVSQKGNRRNRNRNRGKAQAQSQAQTEQGGGGGGPLGAVDEVGETLGGVTDGVGGLVNDTAGKALSKPTEALGGLLSNKKKGGQEGEEEEDAGTNEQLRLRLDLNLDIEVQLKAKIHGDLTLGLLYVVRESTCSKANVSQELVLDPVLLIYHCATYTHTPTRIQQALQRKVPLRSNLHHKCSGSLLSDVAELFKDCFLELIPFCIGLDLEMASPVCNKITISQIIHQILKREKESFQLRTFV
jgi:hypothetical protein